MRPKTAAALALLSIFLALPAFGQGYFINVRHHISAGDPTQTTVYFEGNAYPDLECDEPGGTVTTAFSAIYSTTQSCKKPDGMALWTLTRNAPSAAVSIYPYCAEYLQPGTEHSAMIKTTHAPLRNNFPLCTAPNHLTLDSVNFLAVTMYDISNAPYIETFPAIWDGIWVPPAPEGGSGLRVIPTPPRN